MDVTAHINLMGIIVRGNNNKIRNCVLENMKRSGIVVHGSYNLIDKNFVSNIIGSDDYNKRGNNISVESAPGVIAEYNVIQNNVLLQNPTHNGVNIFPDTQDENQTPMNGNKIINNYIDGTGGGIYTRFQINLEIVGNVIVNSFIDDPRWDTNGGGITFDFNHNFSITPPFSAGTVKIYNNTLYNNEKYGLQNYTSNILKIYNNNYPYSIQLHSPVKNYVDEVTTDIRNQYFDGSDFVNIETGSIYRVWEVNQGYPSTSYLDSYWYNTLVVVNHNSNPRSFWGPLQLGSSTVKYYINKSNHIWGSPPVTFTRFDSTNSSTYEYIDLNENIGSSPYAVSYRMSALLGPPIGEGNYEESDPSDYVTVRLSWPHKLIAGDQSLIYNLSQNYPNPFNPFTIIIFSIPETENVSLMLYDILGNEIKKLVSDKFQPGNYEVTFNSTGLASGIYIYRMTAGKYMSSKKMLVIK